jgi:hypothetical protein
MLQRKHNGQRMHSSLCRQIPEAAKAIPNKDSRPPRTFGIHLKSKASTANLSVPFNTISNMAEQPTPEFDHSWKCFHWKLSDEELADFPCTFDQQVTVCTSSYANLDELGIDNLEGERLIRIEDDFANNFEVIFKVDDSINGYEDDVKKQVGNETSKEYRKVFTLLSSARSDLWLAVGGLIAAQKSATTEDVKDEIIELMERWRGALWDTIVTCNEKIGMSYGVEGPMPRGEKWVGSWPLGSGSFGTTVCERQNNTL